MRENQEINYFDVQGQVCTSNASFLTRHRFSRISH